MLIPTCLIAQAPAGYYNGTSGLAGYALKTKLHDIISEKNKNWHYADLSNFYKQTDLDVYYDHTPANNPYLNANTGTMDYILLDIYSEKPGGADAYEYTSAQLISTANAEGLGYNREHMMPQSTFYSYYPMYSDLNFVIPTDARINQLRNIYPYGVSKTSSSNVFYTFSNTSKIGNSAIPNYVYAGRVYEPVDEFKGDVARGLLYFAVRYEGKLGSYKVINSTSSNPTPLNDQSVLDGTEERAYDQPYIDMLLAWSAQDPVSQREIDRNNAVYAIQGNRNPFIDNPSWAGLIWNQTADAIAPNSPSNLTVSQTGAYFVTLNWSPSTSTDVIGYKVYQNGTLIGFSKGNSFVVDHLSPATAYNFTVKAYDNGYLLSADSNTLSATTLASDVYAKDIFVSKYIEGTANNKAIELYNNTGHPVNLSNYQLISQSYNNTQGVYYYENAYEFEGILQQGERAVIINPNANLSCLTVDQARFVTAAPEMAYNGSQYLELRYKTSRIDALGMYGQSNSSALADVTLYRNSSVNNPNSTFTASEWDVYPVNYCQGTGTLSVEPSLYTENIDLMLYPNPVTDGMVRFKGKDLEKINEIVIVDASGKIVVQKLNPFKNSNEISVSNLSAGVYFVKTPYKTLKFIKK